MAENPISQLQVALQKEKDLLEAICEDIMHYRQMMDERKRDADRCRHHIDDLEHTVAAMLAKIPAEE